MATPKKRVYVQQYCENCYIVKRLVNTVEPPLGSELSKQQVEQLVSEGVAVTVTWK
jgi:hypothetical protein